MPNVLRFKPLQVAPKDGDTVSVEAYVKHDERNTGPCSCWDLQLKSITTGRHARHCILFVRCGALEKFVDGTAEWGGRLGSKESQTNATDD